MKLHDALVNESSRRDIYYCLSKCYKVPDDELKNSLKILEHQLVCLGSKALPHAILMRCSFCAQKIESLQVDFSKLFLGPYSLLAPPYGSVYLEDSRKIMGDSTMDVLRIYHQAGLDVAPTFKETPDHISTELEFMYFLIYKEIEALGARDEQDFIHKLRTQKAFLRAHLGCWVAQFAQTIKNSAQTDFYKNLADTTHIFIAEEMKTLTELDMPQSIMT